MIYQGIINSIEGPNIKASVPYVQTPSTACQAEKLTGNISVNKYTWGLGHVHSFSGTRTTTEGATAGGTVGKHNHAYTPSGSVSSSFKGTAATLTATQGGTNSNTGSATGGTHGKIIGMNYIIKT